ncbi:uncharacterized protein MJAP1_002857 [Malassezia japonica]|uniref:Uncharacterized protein n=1 Tax=Malassezia japonica TaxID=223818 RepID=A0AAF0EZC3_9BASI|nr:uncharacterized protein MJAP1_002857 [Malassezia japonica]WFD39876.1 hypothetical protein MJAP1_002857 [Malassezia japonica]
MDVAVEEPAAAIAGADPAHKNARFLHPEDAISPRTGSPVAQVATEGTFDPKPAYAQTDEEEEETRNVEMNLRRWAEQEKLHRKNSRHATMRNPVPTNSSSGLVRKFSSSLSRVPSHLRSRNTHAPLDNTFEMQGSYGHTADAPRPHRYDSVDSDEGQFVSVGESSEQQALRADQSHSFYEQEPGTGDLGSVSFDDFDENKDPGSVRPEGAQPPTTAAAYDAAVPAADAPYPPEALDSNMASAMAKIRSHNFPTVTVGRASSVQHRKRGERPEEALTVDTSAPYVPHTRRGVISAIPEAAHQDEVEADVVSSKAPSDPFSSPRHNASEPMSAGAISDMHPAVIDMPLAADQNDYQGPAASMHFGEDQRENDVAPSRRWYWSDLLLGCGLCSTDDDDEEQAGRTNPME